jgi:surface antigen
LGWLALSDVVTARAAEQHRVAYSRARAFCTRRALRFAILAAAAAAASGCSFNLPGLSLTRAPEAAAPDPAMTTGSIRPARAQAQQSPLSDQLGPEDIRRAHGALALALDPQGNGSPVSWDNAESRSNGRFTPVSGPYLKDDEVCRAFLTLVVTPADRRSLQGTACRPSGGEWSIRQMGDWKQGG